MMYKIFKALEDNPMKNDFVNTCKKYLGILKLDMTFEEIEKLSKFKFTQILKEKMKYEAFIFLKSQQMKQEKIKNIVYKEFKMQDYLAEGDRNVVISKIIFKARGQTLDIKSQKRWKYEDLQCEGCRDNIETGEEILQCEMLGKNVNKAEYSWFFSDSVKKQILTGKIMIEKLKKRKLIREEVT